MIIDEEIWSDIPEYPNYNVSNHGRVYNIRHNRFLKPRPDNDGYEHVSLYNKGVDRSYLVHRLVALAFIPYEEDEIHVNHLDGNKKNNHESNLEWVTVSENQFHAYRTGLRQPSPKAGRKRTPVRVVETGETFANQHACATAINGQQSSISQCLSGKLKSHRGFTFEYVK